MTDQINKLDPDTAIDIAYDIFLEMAEKILIPPIFFYLITIKRSCRS